MNQTPLWNSIQWNDKGLLAVITQDAKSKDILMMAWMNQQALEKTITTGEAVYWSRSRQRLWHKGEESGHVQKVHSILLDCDGDTLLLQVNQIGGIACHTGRANCFYRTLHDERWEENQDVLKAPADIYNK